MRDDRGRIVPATSPGMRRKRWVLAACIAEGALLGIPPLLAVAGAAYDGWSGLFIFSLWCASGLPVGLIMLPAVLVLLAVCSTDRSARRCRACGYDLSGSAADPDGCVVCPECGAAWRR